MAAENEPGARCNRPPCALLVKPLARASLRRVLFAPRVGEGVGGEGWLAAPHFGKTYPCEAGGVRSGLHAVIPDRLTGAAGAVCRLRGLRRRAVPLSVRLRP